MVPQMHVVMIFRGSTIDIAYCLKTPPLSFLQNRYYFDISKPHPFLILENIV